MEIYLVGGAVRDNLLGLPVTERDWVVVGASEDGLTSQGYTRVGKDFPVFLHPKTKEEYALARTERKIAEGHTGFTCDANANVTLEQDLKRRDLTINAIAKSRAGHLIDPYGGVDDLNNAIFRHVSDAFSEDPLRILRLARFSARFSAFTVHDDTFALMKTMVARGDLSELAAERVYAEIDKTLSTKTPENFFKLLDKLGAGKELWPEITGNGIQLLEKVSRLSKNKAERIAALFWDLSETQIKQLSTRLKLPRQMIDITSLIHFYDTWHDIETMGATKIVACLYSLDAFRRRERFMQINQLFGLISKIQSRPDRSLAWQAIIEATTSIKAKDLMPKYSGPALGKALKSAQADEVSKIMATTTHETKQ